VGSTGSSPSSTPWSRSRSPCWCCRWPRCCRTSAPASRWAACAEEGGQYFAFFLSFAVIARFWLVHHRIVEGIGAYDVPFLLLNLLWILTIVLLPFATQVVGSFPPEPLAVLIYIGTITVSSACLAAITFHVWRRPTRRRHADEAPAAPWAALATTGILVVALLLGTLSRRVNYGAMLLLLLSGPVESWLRRRERAR
jgi:uncharacterized membrane protein